MLKRFEQGYVKRFLWLAMTLIVLLGLITPVAGNIVPSGAKGDFWLFDLSSGPSLPLHPNMTQWFTLEGELQAVTIIDGRLAVYIMRGEKWIESHRFGPSDITVTAFQLRDLDGDEVPEIIAGTTEPGFLYIFKLDVHEWRVINSGKYVWSAITSIAVGNFDESSGGGTDILVQNKEGTLYLLRYAGDSLSLLWKSPNVWRSITSSLVVDFNADGRDEIIVTYKTGGLSVIRSVNKQMIMECDHYPWGKVLDMVFGDFDGDKQKEALFCTSQKVVYLLDWAEQKYQLQSRFLPLEYLTEKLLYYQKNGKDFLCAADTAGKVHFLEYENITRQWREFFATELSGRIAELLLLPESEEFFIWNTNRSTTFLKVYPLGEVQLRSGETLYEIQPPPMLSEQKLFLSPQVFQVIPELAVSSKRTSTNLTVFQQDQPVLEIPLPVPKTLKIGDADYTGHLVVDERCYLPMEDLGRFFGLSLELIVREKQIVVSHTPESTETPEPTALTPSEETPDSDLVVASPEPETTTREDQILPEISPEPTPTI